MSSDWRPDDSLLDRNAKGEVQGARRVNDVLRKRGIQVANRVTTSRDPGMAGVRTDLKRTGMPRGVEQWQLPVVPLENVLVFISVMKPRTIVPMHAHRVWVFRIVITGSLKYGRRTLKPGDWMLVPPGFEYSIESGPTGCTIAYAHCVVGPIPHGPGPGPSGRTRRGASGSAPR